MAMVKYDSEIKNEMIRNRVTQTMMSCVICGTEYDTQKHLECPKCAYPVFAFCDQETQMGEMVTAYRKMNGIRRWRLQVGQSYKMGRYGGEEILWKVLAVKPASVLLISEKGLAASAYNENLGDTEWETCRLKKWLNTDFMDEAFDEKERGKILRGSGETDEHAGQVTDKVFLLSAEEVERFFPSDQERCCRTSLYAKKNGAYIHNMNQCCFWWLRTAGHDRFAIATVLYDGRINDVGNYADNEHICVRPALWIDPEGIYQEEYD